MKNLFDYATKELSQDAFLMWFLENWDDERIGEYSLGFIRMLTEADGNPLALKKEDIDKERTFSDAQADHMDIRFEIGLKNGERYLIIIEDKTGSGTGSQLQRYNETIKNKGMEKVYKHIYKLYYKTFPIGNGEADTVKQFKWAIVDFETRILPFFQRIQKKGLSGSDVLEDYAEHIVKLHKQRTEMPKGNPRKWNFTQWNFFLRHILEQIKAKREENLSIESWVYRGHVLCCALYYHRDENRQYPLIEFTVRNPEWGINAAIHMATLKRDGEWTWKMNGDYGPQYSKYWEAVRDAIAESSSPYFKKAPHRKDGKQQTFGTSKKPVQIDFENPGSIKEDIEKAVDEFFRLVLAAK